MKNKNRYTIMMSLATMLLGLVSCSSEEGTDNMAGTADLQLTTEISTTRSIIESTAFSAGDQVSLYVSGAANAVTTATAVNDAGKWVIDPVVKLNAQRVGLVGLANLAETIVPDSKGNQNDILIGLPLRDDGNSINAGQPTVNMHFDHALARVSFTLTQSNGSGVLTRLALVNVGSGSAITTDIDTKGMISGAHSAAELMASEGNYTSRRSTYLAYVTKLIESGDKASSLELNQKYQLSEKEQTISLLVIPTTINSSNRVNLVLTIDGIDYAVELPSGSWSRNNHYLYPVTIDLSKDQPVAVSIGQATINKWSSTGESEPIEKTWNMD